MNPKKPNVHRTIFGEGKYMKGSLTLWVPDVAEMNYPWKVKYDRRWQKKDDYCSSVKKKPPYNKGPRLLDIMDTAIFDFLISNTDRHDYQLNIKNTREIMAC